MAILGLFFIIGTLIYVASKTSDRAQSAIYLILLIVCVPLLILYIKIYFHVAKMKHILQQLGEQSLLKERPRPEIPRDGDTYRGRV